MKNIFKIIAASLLLVSACEEEAPPGLNFTAERSIFDTTYITNVLPAPQATNVLIEDFTAIRCINCPRAQRVAKSIMDAHPDRVYILGIHPGNGVLSALTKPFDLIGDDHESKYDFRTKEGGEILTFLGIPQGLPNGAINRTIFNGETKRIIDETKWNGNTENLLTTNSIVNIDTFGKKGVYFFDGNKIRMNIKLTYTANSNDSQFVSIAVIEDHLIDPQEDGTQIVDNYEHNHILRRTITPSLGSPLRSSIIAGRVFEKTYEYEMTSTDLWNKDNLKVIVFVHGTDNISKFNILQVKEYEIH